MQKLAIKMMESLMTFSYHCVAWPFLLPIEDWGTKFCLAFFTLPFTAICATPFFLMACIIMPLTPAWGEYEEKMAENEAVIACADENITPGCNNESV